MAYFGLLSFYVSARDSDLAENRQLHFKDSTLAPASQPSMMPPQPEDHAPGLIVSQHCDEVKLTRNEFELQAKSDVHFIVYHMECTGGQQSDIATAMCRSCQIVSVETSSDNATDLRIRYYLRSRRIIADFNVNNTWLAIQDKEHPHHNILRYWKAYSRDPAKGRPKKYIKGMGVFHPVEFEIRFLVGLHEYVEDRIHGNDGKGADDHCEKTVDLNRIEIGAAEERGADVAMNIFSCQSSGGVATRKGEAALL
ncbi:MAG: hypothetical protein Q9170_002041 [Blastenia crenularia]